MNKKKAPSSEAIRGLEYELQKAISDTDHLKSLKSKVSAQEKLISQMKDSNKLLLARKKTKKVKKVQFENVQKTQELYKDIRNVRSESHDASVLLSDMKRDEEYLQGLVLNEMKAIPSQTREILEHKKLLQEVPAQRAHAFKVKLSKQRTTQNRSFGEFRGKLTDHKKFMHKINGMAAQLQEGKRIFFDIADEADAAYKNRKQAYRAIQRLRDRAKSMFIGNCEESEKLVMKIADLQKLDTFLTTKNKEIEPAESVDDDSLSCSTVTEVSSPTLTREEYTHILNETMDALGVERRKDILPKVEDLRTMNLEDIKFKIKDNMALDWHFEELRKMQESVDKATKDKEKMDRVMAEETNPIEQQILLSKDGMSLSHEYCKKYGDSANQLMEGVQKLFKTLECDTEPIKSLLGQNDATYAENHKAFIEACEKRVLEIQLATWQREDMTTPYKTTESRSRPKVRPASMCYESLRTPCGLCALNRDLSEVTESSVRPVDSEKMFDSTMNDDDDAFLLHDLEKCPMSEARVIIQKEKKMM